MSAAFASPSRLGLNPEVRAALEARMSGVSPPALEDNGADISKKRSRRKPEHPTHVVVHHSEDTRGTASAHKKPRGTGIPDLADTVQEPREPAAQSADSLVLPDTTKNAGRPASAQSGRSLPATAGLSSSVIGTTIGFGPEAPPAPVPADIMRSSKPLQLPPTAPISTLPEVTITSTSVVSPAVLCAIPSAVVSPSATGSTVGTSAIPASALSSVAAGAQSGRTIPWYFRGGSGPLTQQQEQQGGCILFPDASTVDPVRSASMTDNATDSAADLGGDTNLSARALVAERELLRLAALNAALQASSQSLKSALKEAADAVRAAKTEANESRMSVQHEKEERTAERARAAAEDRETKIRRDATLLNLAGVMQRMAQLEGVARLEKLNLQMARLGRLVTVRSGTGNAVDVWEDGTEFLRIKSAEERLSRLREQIEANRKLATKANRQQSQAIGRVRRNRGAATAAASGPTVDDTEEDDDDANASGAGTMTADTDSFLDADTQAHLAAIRGFAAESAVASNASATLSGATAARQVFVDPLAALERTVRDETMKQGLANVKAEQAELVELRRTLEQERALLLLDFNRHKNESASKWRSLPFVGRDGSPQYQLLQLMGRGGFSEVWRAMDLNSVSEVAVKLHQLHEHWPREKKENFVKHALRESSIQLEMQHPHIVLLLDAFPFDDNTFVTVLEYCAGADLDQLLKQQSFLPERDAKKVLTQVLSALAFLNGYRLDSPQLGAGDPSQMLPPPPRRKIIHYDLKPANILFDALHAAKVTDFGLSKIIDDGSDGGLNTSMELTSQGAGTYWYLPPECFRTDAVPRVSSKVDVWAMGVIFFQMLFGRRPFGEGQSQEQILQAGTMLEQTRIGPVFPDRPVVSRGAQDFIRRCLTYNVDLRPDMLTLCRDPFLLQTTDSRAGSSASRR